MKMAKIATTLSQSMSYLRSFMLESPEQDHCPGDLPAFAVNSVSRFTSYVLNYSSPIEQRGCPNAKWVVRSRCVSIRVAIEILRVVDKPLQCMIMT